MDFHQSSQSLAERRGIGRQARKEAHEYQKKNVRLREKERHRERGGQRGVRDKAIPTKSSSVCRVTADVFRSGTDSRE